LSRTLKERFDITLGSVTNKKVGHRIFGYDELSMEEILKLEYEEVIVTENMKEGIDILMNQSEIVKNIHAGTAGLWPLLEV